MRESIASNLDCDETVKRQLEEYFHDDARRKVWPKDVHTGGPSCKLKTQNENPEADDDDVVTNLKQDY